MKSIIMAGTLFLTSGFAWAGAASDENLAHAKAATASFGKALKSELVTAMQSGGPVAAIEVCNLKAPGIAEAVALEQGVAIYRVSLKNRNPDNVPNDWQTAVLQEFEQRKTGGEEPDSLAWSETRVVEGGKEFRFMKAIPTATVCLACHGETLAAPVAQRISELYPDDKATGFSEGDIRGAFVVVKNLQP
jgi:hypothetical protein